jgi:DNA-binding NtrC family response regulator
MTAARILCVDDDPSINELNEIVLTRAGYEVEVAESPADALARLSQGPYDLVITDLFTPKASDAQFLSKIRTLAPTIPVIIVSGNHTPDPDVLKHADAFIEKAYSLNALTDAVRELLTREKLRRIG